MSTSDWAVNATLDSTGGQAIPAGTVYGQYGYNAQGTNAYQYYNQGPVYLWERYATGPTVATGTTTNWTLSGIPGGTGSLSIIYCRSIG
jgi:hypothetical protein